MPRRPLDLTGRRFGKLVAVKRTDIREHNRAAKWLCHCDCGGYIYVDASNLLAGHYRSCGCLRGKPSKPPDTYPAREDCWAYDKASCKCLNEMFCVTRGKCKFYDTEDDYARKQKGTAAE